MSKGPGVGADQGENKVQTSGEETEADEAEKTKATSKAFSQPARRFRLHLAGVTGPGSGRLWMGWTLGSQIYA